MYFSFRFCMQLCDMALTGLRVHVFLMDLNGLSQTVKKNGEGEI